MNEQEMAHLVEQVVAGEAVVLWCAGGDHENAIARATVQLSADDPAEVAGVIGHREDGDVRVVGFVHNDDKQELVERVEQTRLDKDRGQW